MRLRTTLATALGAALALTCILLPAWAQAETITIGTTAPKHSPWGKVFRVWNKAVKKKSDGQLELKFYWNNQQGSEEAMVGKMRAGQLDGAAVSAVGLGKVYQPILVLQVPGFFDDWATLDRVREALLPELKEGARQNGFYLGGIGDVGLYRLMSKGRALRTPDDLRGMKPNAIVGEPIIPVVAQVLGLTPQPISIAEVLPNLNAGRINVVIAPALVAEQLQWAPQLDHVTDSVLGTGIGSLVFAQQSLDRLSPDLRELLTSTARKAGKMLTKRIRKEDDEAWKRLQGRMTVVKLSADDRAKWDELSQQVRTRLAQGTFSPALIERVRKLAGK